MGDGGVSGEAVPKSLAGGTTGVLGSAGGAFCRRLVDGERNWSLSSTLEDSVEACFSGVLSVRVGFTGGRAVVGLSKFQRSGTMMREQCRNE